MGLFGRIFEKKYCAICGAEVGMLGRSKIEDGYLCSDCAGKLSPYFEGRRHSTTEQIKEQLAYREENKKAVAAFNPTRTIRATTSGSSGGGMQVMLDEDAGKVIVTSNADWRETNPDVFEFSHVTGCDYDVDENRTEIKYTNNKGERVSFNPPRYDYDYDFYVTIHLNHPYATKIRFKVNKNTIERRGSAEYVRAEDACQQIRDALSQVREGVRSAKAPKAAVQCPHCLATTYPDASGCCEYCGGALT